MQVVRHQVYFILRGLQKIVDTVLPPRCPVSGDIVEKQGMLSPESWKALEFIVDPYCSQCGVPFEFGAEEGIICGQCIEHPPVFTAARAALKYNDTSRDLVLGFKHADKLYAVRTFTPMLQQAGAGFLGEADMLVPVPLHFWRILKRRYNQAALIAADLGKETMILVIPDILQRIRATPPQGHKKAKDRRKNVKGAFRVSPRHLRELQGKRIVLIDDVLTTGSTVNECAKVLLEAGASSVHVLAVAKTVRE